MIFESTISIGSIRFILNPNENIVYAIHVLTTSGIFSLGKILKFLSDPFTILWRRDRFLYGLFWYCSSKKLYSSIIGSLSGFELVNTSVLNSISSLILYPKVDRRLTLLLLSKNESDFGNFLLRVYGP